MPSPSSAPSSPPGRPRLLAWLLLALSIGVLVVMWVLLALYTERQHAWMAVIVGLDAAWVLRFGGWRSGPGRAALATGTTLLVVTAAQWGIIAGHIGTQMGLSPWASSLKLGFHHAWFMAQLANDAWDWACLAAGLLIATLAAR